MSWDPAYFGIKGAVNAYYVIMERSLRAFYIRNIDYADCMSVTPIMYQHPTDISISQ